MQGKVSIYKGYLRDGVASLSKTPIFEESNLIVDGAKEHVVDMLTRVPYPSGVDAEVSSGYNVSNYTIRGLSVSPNRSAFNKIHATAALSGIVIIGSPLSATGPSSLDTNYNITNPTELTLTPISANVTVDGAATINNDAENAVYSNNALENPTFSSITSLLGNGTFKEYSLDASLSGFSMNKVLNLYTINEWDTRSYLRYNPQVTEFDDSIKLGSLARYDMENVPGVSSLIAQGAGKKSDGVLYVRSFAAADEGSTSGAVWLSQQARMDVSILSPLVTSQESLGVIAEITAQFSSVSGGADASILVRLENETAGVSYNFSSTATYDRNTWGGSGVPFAINAVKDVSGTFSHFVNIPNTNVNDVFRVSYQFAAHNSANILKCYFWNSNVNFIDGWYYGHIFKEDTLRRVYNNDYATPSLYMTCSGGAGGGAAASALPLSSTTYISQSVQNINPLKKYSPNVFAVSGDVTPATTQYLDFAFIKRTSSDTRLNGNFNFLSDVRCSDLQESRLPPAYAPHPDMYAECAPDNRVLHQNVKPTDLCLSIQGASNTLSGTVELLLNYPTILRGSVLTKTPQGLETAPVEISIRTASVDGTGRFRWFNFNDGTWDSVSGTSNAFQSSSTGFGVSSGYADFVTNTVNINSLLGKVRVNPTTNGIDFNIYINSATRRRAFVKDLSLRGNAPPATSQVQEYMDWTSTSGTNKWIARNADESFGQYSFSGVGLYPSVIPTPTQDLGALHPVSNMHLAASSVHSVDSEYQFAIFNTRNYNTGGAIEIKAAGLFDAATAPSLSVVSGDVFTSESYYYGPNFDISGETYVQYYDGNSVFPAYSGISVGAGAKNPTAAEWALVSSVGGLVVGTAINPAGGLYSPHSTVSRILEIGDLKVSPTGTEVVFSVDFQQINANSEGDPRTQWNAVAELENGQKVWYDASSKKWDVYNLSATPGNSFTWFGEADPEVPWARGQTTAAPKLYELFKTVLTPPINIDDGRFTDKTRIRFSIESRLYSTSSINILRNWEFYAVGSGLPPRDLPEFPTPIDEWVQTPNLKTAELGQYGNKIEYAETLSGVTEREALAMASWAPASGTSALSVSGIPQTSLANTLKVVNSDGYVYPGYLGPGSFASVAPIYFSGFHTETSSLGGGSSALVITYDISSSDMNFFDHQGGVGAMGLWTFDVDKTYEKLVDNGYDVSTVYDISGLAAGTLYNLDEETRNPVFKLFSKKAFRTPIMHDITPESFVRVIWAIKFI